MELPDLFQSRDDNKPKSTEDHVDIAIENLNEQIHAATDEGEDVLASVLRAQGAIMLSRFRAQRQPSRLAERKIERWIQRQLPKAENGHFKRALEIHTDGQVKQTSTDQQGIDADGSEDTVADDVHPTRDLDSLVGEDLRSRLYTRVVARIMAAYEVDADIPVYKQDNDNPGAFLFRGVPGTGKTHAAEGVVWVLSALGYDTGFYPATGSQIKSSDYGESEQRLEQLLRRADTDDHEVSVVFFDEFEDIANRSEHQATAAIANTLQSLTSGADVVDSVVVIGATNHPERVSDAIHSRFTSVEFREPTRDAKLEMLAHYLGDARQFSNERLDTIDDRLLDGLTGRDMKLAARNATDNSLLDGDAARPTNIEDMETVRQQLQNTPEVSINDLTRALQNRH